MIVYRYLCKEELELLKNKKVKKLGRYFGNSNDEYNNLKYNENSKYIHFFARFKDFEQIKKYRLNQNRLIGVYYMVKFDIPEEILNKNKGYGYYPDKNTKPNIKCLEYAVDMKDFDIDWFVDYIVDKDTQTNI